MSESLKLKQKSPTKQFEILSLQLIATDSIADLENTENQNDALLVLFYVTQWKWENYILVPALSIDHLSARAFSCIALHKLEIEKKSVVQVKVAEVKDLTCFPSYKTAWSHISHHGASIVCLLTWTMAECYWNLVLKVFGQKLQKEGNMDVCIKCYVKSSNNCQNISFKTTSVNLVVALEEKPDYQSYKI